ncbi:MAG: hypothetical protein NTY80_01005 [candidate division SR1 bacterium]|nr:hypothetical protein [candidate division SR1 bacterium]
MKLKRLLLLLAFTTFPSFAAYQQQGFSQFQELDGNINFSCTSQCVAVIGLVAGRDYISLKGTLQGNGVIGYGFVIGQQIIPADTVQINGLTTLDQQFSFSKFQYYSQVPKDAQLVIIVQGNVDGNQFVPQVGALSFFENFGNGVRQALEYKEYNPRTINFLEGPMRNGYYINQYFFPWICVLLILSLVLYLLSSSHKNKEMAIYFGAGVLVFFWVFLDFFSTNNQIKIYKQNMSATNIMQNGRMGRSSDFYQFLDFIKTKVPKGSPGSFIAPYPFDFEGRYHIYPDVKFNALTGVDYIFFYNPYGANSPFGFVDPVYSGGLLTWGNFVFSVQEEVVWQPYAKIYKLLSK